MGAERASRAAERLIAAGARALISFGTCAGLHPQLHSGDLVLPINIIGQQQRYVTEHPWRSRLRDRLSTALKVHELDLADVQDPLHTAEQKRGLAENSCAAAADMESLAVAACAERHGRPFLAVRVVLDCVDTNVPMWISAITDEYGRPRPIDLLRAAVGDPRGAGHLLPLVLRSRRALATLRLHNRRISAPKTKRFKNLC
jgi:adenosylhomocysteine nucleosidase